MISFKEHIVKVKGGYRLVSKKTGKNLGTYPSEAGAENRERQVQYFKHANESASPTLKRELKRIYSAQILRSADILAKQKAHNEAIVFAKKKVNYKDRAPISTDGASSI
jgi:hypothetical protein